MNIRKIDAANEQLEIAIDLFCTGKSLISAHTLAAVAYDVLRDVNTHAKGTPTLIKDVYIQIIDKACPHLKKKHINSINRQQNYLKHANKDPKQSLEFDSELTEIFIIDACETYRNLTGRLSQNASIFRIWFCMKHLECFKDGSAEKEQLQKLNEKYQSSSIESFYKNMKKANHSFHSITASGGSE